MKSEKTITNNIYLMHTLSQLYIKKYKIDMQQFLELDKEVNILGIVCENPGIFDGLPDDLMLQKAEEIIYERQKH